MLDCLAAVLGSSQQNGVLSCWSHDGKLIESDDFTASLQNAGTCGFSEAQSADTELGDVEKTDIICDGADNDGNFVLLALHELGEFGEGERRAVHLGHK